MAYRKCFVPSCVNDTKKFPNKMFVRIREDLREKWCREVKTDYFKVYKMYCCEDHLEPREDLENYYQYKLMKNEPKLKRTALLRNINQKNTKKLSELNKLMLQHTSTTKPLNSKQDYLLSPSTSGVNKTLKRKYKDETRPSTSSCSTLPIKINTATQCQVTMVDKSTNYKSRKQIININTVNAQSSSETSSAATPSVCGWTSETEESTVFDTSNYVLNSKNVVLDMVLHKPKMYLGLPKQFLWLIDYIVEKNITKIDSLQLIVTLLKIKQNDSLERISDQFKISRPKLASMILSGIEVLANFFQNLVFSPSYKQIKQNLPLVFKIRYSNVQMIIDCFEIVILADRGFKEIEPILSSRKIKLLRPPSVYAGIKLTTAEAIQGKVIASLRVHVERVIRRVREYALLKSHSVVNYKYVPYLDEIVMIVCGLINLQGEIIKSD